VLRGVRTNLFAESAVYLLSKKGEDRERNG
jgi:hypothetical protein